MLYIDPNLGGSAEFGDLRDSVLNLSIEGDAPVMRVMNERSAVPAAVAPNAPADIPWWLIVFGVFLFLALNENRR